MAPLVGVIFGAAPGSGGFRFKAVLQYVQM